MTNLSLNDFKRTSSSDSVSESYVEALKVFTNGMLERLEENRSKGSREDWQDPNQFSDRFFLAQAYNNLLNLEQAYRQEDWETVRQECQDVANFMMMISERTKTD